MHKPTQQFILFFYTISWLKIFATDNYKKCISMLQTKKLLLVVGSSVSYMLFQFW